MAEHSNTLVTVKSNLSLQTETDAKPDSTDEEQSEKAVIPTLVCESTDQAIPPNLQRIIESLSSYGASDSNKTDLLICVLYVLMIETGFIPKQCRDMFDDLNVDFHIGRLQSLFFLPGTWKTFETNSYKFEFILEPFPDRVCKMSCVVMNQNLTVNLILTQLGNYCVHLVINNYILQENFKPVSRKFQNLNELSIIFKNEVALAAKNAILTIEGVPHASLQELPTEIVYKIFIRLEAVDFVHLKCTCRRMKYCANFFEHQLWEQYFKKEFPRGSFTGTERWDIKYKEEFQLRLLRKRREQSAARGVKRRPLLFYDNII